MKNHIKKIIATTLILGFISSSTISLASPLVVYDAQYDCNTTDLQDDSTNSLSSATRKKLIEIAKTQLGVPYRWGATEWDVALDCSGFTQGAYKRVGIDIPRISHEQSSFVKVISKEEAKEGDLVFWGGDYNQKMTPGNATHVAIYLGNDQIIHAPVPGKTVEIINLYGQPMFGSVEGLAAKDKEGGKSKGKEDDTSNGTGIPNVEHVKTIYNYMHKNYGFSAEFIAGIIGNFITESELDPMTVEGYYGKKRNLETAKANTLGATMGIGWGQNTGGRHTALVNWAKDKHGDPYKWVEPEVQLDYMFHGDGGYVKILKQLALDSNNNVLDNTVAFHNKWEVSADSYSKVVNARGGNSKKVYEYMLANGMNGKKDTAKIEKMGGETSSGSINFSSSNSSDGEYDQNCIVTDTEDSNGSGKMGQSVEVNGKRGRIIGGVWTYDTVPDKYADAMTLPKFTPPDWSTSPFNGRLSGQCTELTWAYMSQLYDGKQPSNGNGGVVYQSYQSAGAKVTDRPTVGYGFSSRDGKAGSSTGPYGHTGVCIAVYPDGSWLGANFNFPPHSAPERYLSILLFDGTDGTIKFFSGIGQPKTESAEDKVEEK